MLMNLLSSHRANNIFFLRTKMKKEKLFYNKTKECKADKNRIKNQEQRENEMTRCIFINLINLLQLFFSLPLMPDGHINCILIMKLIIMNENKQHSIKTLTLTLSSSTVTHEHLISLRSAGSYNTFNNDGNFILIFF